MGTAVAAAAASAAKRGSSQPFALPWSPLLAVTALLWIVIGNEVAAGSVYPGVIELVGYSNRRARTHYNPPPQQQVGAAAADSAATVSPPPAKIQADIETVKQNIEKYNKLLTLDTRNLPDSQKDMLERIVERVARLKESLDITNNEQMLRSQDFDARQTDYLPTTELSTRPMLTETETDPTLILDETTLLQLQTSMDELAAAHASVTAQTTRMRETTAIPTTDANSLTGSDSDESVTASNDNATGITQANNEEATTMDPTSEKEATEPDSQLVAARSNNHNSIAAITAADIDNETSDAEPGTTTVNGSQRTLTTSGKLSKTRATKRPGSGTKVTLTSAQTIRQRPPVGSSAAGLHKHTVTGSSSSSTTSTKHKHTTQGYTTTQPQQQQQYHSTKQKIKPQVQAQSPSQSQYYQQKQPATVDKVAAASQSPLPASSGLTTTPGAAVRNPSYATTGNISDAAAPAPADLYNANPHTNSNNDMVYDPQVNASAIIDSLNNAREEYYQQKQTINGNINSNINKDNKKPSSATAKPTKYHYYPHNQHIYLLPECAIQQVCNAVYVRLNYTQPLCACPSRYRDPCSASLNEDDQHTTKLVGDGKKKAITLAKTCEATTEMRECRSPKDWSLLALQNTRTGKSHYLVICRCPDHFKMEGPMAHDQPTYASVPGIRVFGMMCVKPGYSVRKPSAQPPKRYQLQKPIYRPGNGGGSTGGLVQNSYINNNQYVSGAVGGSSSNKDVYGRPTSSLTSSSSNTYHPSEVFQSQQNQANYQYLNRPDSVVSIGSYRPDSSQLPQSINNNNFPTTIYGRNNERKGDTPIEAVTEEDARESTNAPATGDGELAGPQKRTTSGEHSDELSAAAASTLALEEEHGETGETTISEAKREKRSATMAEPMQFNEFNDDTPAFPWDRVIEFQQSIVWD